MRYKTVILSCHINLCRRTYHLYMGTFLIFPTGVNTFFPPHKTKSLNAWFQLPPRSSWALRFSVLLEVMVRNYRYSLRDISEQQSSRRLKMYFLQQFPPFFFTRIPTAVILWGNFFLLSIFRDYTNVLIETIPLCYSVFIK